MSSSSEAIGQEQRRQRGERRRPPTPNRPRDRKAWQGNSLRGTGSTKHPHRRAGKATGEALELFRYPTHPPRLSPHPEARKMDFRLGASKLDNRKKKNPVDIIAFLR